MMTKGSRILVLVTALTLGLVYALPLWRIRLEAPQYPEGLGMLIRINTIEGVKQHDLANINNLNHYIGMKRIEPESIPELRLMPVLLGLFMGLGVLAAGVGRRRALYAFTGLFLGFAIAGLVDFWLWNYDYGHNLDHENAIIKVPGMSYQPPLIGSRQILNFRAHSWPGAGGWILIAAGGVFALATLLEWRRGRLDRPRARSGRPAGAVPLLAAATCGAALCTAACGEPAPRAIVWGTDACEACRMSLADEGHAAQAVTKTGRSYVFDSIECLAGWLRRLEDPGTIHSLWVTDFPDRPALVRAEEAFFLASRRLASPMGLGLTAFASREDRDTAMREFGGEALDWDGVRAFVAARWSGAQPSPGMGGHGSHAETLAPPS